MSFLTMLQLSTNKPIKKSPHKNQASATSRIIKNTYSLRKLKGIRIQHQRLNILHVQVQGSLLVVPIIRNRIFYIYLD